MRTRYIRHRSEKRKLKFKSQFSGSEQTMTTHTYGGAPLAEPQGRQAAVSSERADMNSKRYRSSAEVKAEFDASFPPTTGEHAKGR